MLDLQEIALECMEELDAIGIEYGNIIEFEINTRAQRRWGQCKAIPGGYSINISIRLLQDEKARKGLKETILHELAHSCKGCMNHGTEWKRIVAKINKAYGYNIKRTNSAEDKQVESLPIEAYRHKVVCCGCGKEVYKMRECSITQYPQLWKCGRCGNNFKRVY